MQDGPPSGLRAEWVGPPPPRQRQVMPMRLLPLLQYQFHPSVSLPSCRVIGTVWCPVRHDRPRGAKPRGHKCDRSQRLFLDEPKSYRVGTSLRKTLIIRRTSFRIGMAFHANRPGCAGSDKICRLMQCLCGGQTDFGLVEIEEDIGRKFYANFASRFSNPQVLSGRLSRFYRKDEFEHATFDFLHRRPQLQHTVGLGVSGGKGH